jgi:hypothetical protein
MPCRLRSSWRSTMERNWLGKHTQDDASVPAISPREGKRKGLWIETRIQQSMYFTKRLAVCAVFRCDAYHGMEFGQVEKHDYLLGACQRCSGVLLSLLHCYGRIMYCMDDYSEVVVRIVCGPLTCLHPPSRVTSSWWLDLFSRAVYPGSTQAKRIRTFPLYTGPSSGGISIFSTTGSVQGF